MRDDKQKKIASETVYIYAPLAHRLGLYNIKSELEDLSLKYNNPDVYYDIANKLELAKDNREKYVEEFKKEFLSMKFADDDYEIAMKNLSKKSLMELSATLGRDGTENNAMSFGNMHQSIGNKNMVQTNPLLNPFAWGALIKQIMDGDKKRNK